MADKEENGPSACPSTAMANNKETEISTQDKEESDAPFMNSAAISPKIGTRFTINRKLLPVKLFYFTVLGGIGALLPFIALYMKQIGLTSEETGVIYGVMPFIGFLVRPFMGSLADRFHKHKFLLVLSCVLTSVFYWLLLFVPYDTLDFTPVKADIVCDRNYSFIQNHNNTAATNCPLSFHHSSTSPHWPNNVTVAQINATSHSYTVLQVEEGKKGETVDSECSVSCQLSKETQTSTLCFSDSVGQYNESKCQRTIHLTGKLNEIKFTLRNISKLSQRQLLHDNELEGYKIKTVTYKGKTNSQMKCNSETKLQCKMECTKSDVTHCKRTRNTKTAATLWIYVALFLFGNIFFAPIISLGDALAYDILGDKRNQWGKQRLWGTVGFAIFAVTSTLIVDLMSSNPMRKDFSISFYMFGILTLLTGFVSYKMDTSDEVSCKNMLKDICTLIRNPVILCFLLATLYFGMLTGAIEAFLYWYLQDHLGNTKQIIPGLCLVVSCAGEVPMLSFSGYFIKRFGHLPCLYVVFFGYSLRFFFYSILENAWHVLPVELLHSICFGLMWAAASSYASIIAPKGMSATMQGVISGLNFGIGKGIGSLLTGVLYDSGVLGPVWTFRFYSITSLVVMLLYILVNKFVLRSYSLPSTNNNECEEEELKQTDVDHRKTSIDVTSEK